MAEIKPTVLRSLLLVSVFLLSFIGLLILTSASFSIAKEKYGDSFYFLKRQIFFGFLPGIFLGTVAFLVDFNLLKKISPLLFFFNIFLLILVFLPFIGVKIGGATRWIKIGNLTFQPSEILKVTFILYLAALLDGKKKEKLNFLDFLKLLTLFFIVGLILLLQPDFSTFLIIALIFAILYFLAGTPFWHTIFLAILFLISALILGIKANYRLQRVLVLLNPTYDPLGAGYHLKQSLISIGSGGLFGVGLGKSQQKFSKLPSAFTDSIFCVLAEETGFFGAILLLLLYLIFFILGITIGIGSKSSFLRLVSFGISFWIFIQALINIGAMSGLAPLTGIPLPFLSYGGSALISELIGVGLLLNASKT
jgi:cell division protein FtsW